MIEIINALAENYAAKFTSSSDKLLLEIQELNKQHPHSNMLSGPVQGKLLEVISRIMRPERILEVGTFLGFSSLCLAKGLLPDGQLHTLELDEETAKTARGFFTKSSHSQQIILHRGVALEILDSLDEMWDLVFIDADKINYINYYELILPKVKKGGLILADNVLFHGDVLEQKIRGKNAIAINAFNQHVAGDNRVEQVIATVRDGLMFILKK